MLNRASRIWRDRKGKRFKNVLSASKKEIFCSWGPAWIIEVISNYMAAWGAVYHRFILTHNPIFCQPPPRLGQLFGKKPNRIEKRASQVRKKASAKKFVSSFYPFHRCFQKNEKNTLYLRRAEETYPSNGGKYLTGEGFPFAKAQKVFYTLVK